jgi:Ca2+/Na+ antiporter
MRKTFLILSCVFAFLSILFSVLPLDTLAFVPIGLAIICLVVTFIKSDVSQRVWPKRLFMITYICAAFVLIKTYFVKDEVAVDQQFEQQKIETKQEAKKDLEELEGLE